MFWPCGLESDGRFVKAWDAVNALANAAAERDSGRPAQVWLQGGGMLHEVTVALCRSGTQMYAYKENAFWAQGQCPGRRLRRGLRRKTASLVLGCIKGE